MRLENLEDLYNLSPLQEGVLFHSLYSTEFDVYARVMSCALDGDLNASAFGQAWRRLMDRHSILRTSFHWEGLDKPLQVVCRQVEVPLIQIDWTGLPQKEQEQRLEAFVEQERSQRFDLSQAPLMRLTLIRLAEDAYQFIWSYHHLLLDGWSRFLLLKEFMMHYDSLRRGQRLNLDPSYPYRAYIAWLQKQDPSKAELFWRRALKGFITPNVLGIDRVLKKDAAFGPDFTERKIQLSSQETAALNWLSRRHRITFNILVQGAWALLQRFYSGEMDVVFGAVVSGRPADLLGVEKIVGPFINTLPVRVKVPMEAQLLPWLKEFQLHQVEMHQHMYSPLVQIQGWSEAPRGLPLFETVLVFENYPVDVTLREQVGNLKITRSRFYESSNYKLTVMASLTEILSLKILYDSNRLDSVTIVRTLKYLRTILVGFVDHLDRRLDAIVGMVKDLDRQQQVKEKAELEESQRQRLMIVKRAANSRAVNLSRDGGANENSPDNC